MANLMVVGVGGFLGAVARYLIYLIIGNFWAFRFPLATLVVNVVGSFILGALVSVFNPTSQSYPSLYLLGAVGFVGAFTTFSAFSLDNLLLIESGLGGQAAVNIGVNVFVCIGSVFLGRLLFS